MGKFPIGTTQLIGIDSEVVKIVRLVNIYMFPHVKSPKLQAELLSSRERPADLELI